MNSAPAKGMRFFRVKLALALILFAVTLVVAYSEMFTGRMIP